MDLLLLNMFEEFWVKFLMTITLPIYSVAKTLFSVFFTLATGKLISSEQYGTMLSNVYLLIGIVMLFVIAFAMLKYMVNPDEEKKGGTTFAKKIVVNLITSALILILLPTVFTFAFDFQKSMITDYNVIGRFFGFGETNSEASNTTNNSAKIAAYGMVNSVYTAFFNVNVEECAEEVVDDTTLMECQESVTGESGSSFLSTMVEVSNTGRLELYGDFAKAYSEDKIEFHFLLSLICGAILLYVIASFCIDMAIRMVKLVFYQVIAPLPIFFRIVPNSKLSDTFKKWIKITLTCYLEVFVRIIAIYFALYMITKMFQSDFLQFNSGWSGPLEWLIVKALVAMAIVVFIKKVPKLLSEVTGLDSSGMKLGIKDKLKEGGFFTAANAVGALGSAGAELVKNAVATNKNKWSGATKGERAKIIGKSAAGVAKNALKAGFAGGVYGHKNANLKGIGLGQKNAQEYIDAINEGATDSEIRKNKLRNAFGFSNTSDSEERRIKKATRNFTNQGLSDIVITDDSGKEIKRIKTGETVSLSESDLKLLEAQKTRNNGEAAKYNEKIKTIDKLKSFSDSQKVLKKTVSTEHDEKWKDGSWTHEVSYIGEDGLEHTEVIGAKRFDELTKKNVQFIDASSYANVRYRDANGVEQVARKMSRSDVERLYASGDLVDFDTIKVTDKKVQDDSRTRFMEAQLQETNDNLIKQTVRSFYNSLESNQGFKYSKIITVNGQEKTVYANVTSKIDESTGKRIITRENLDKDGNKLGSVVFTDNGDGTMNKVEFDISGHQISTPTSVSAYSVASDEFDKAAKSYSGILDEEKRQIEENYTDGLGRLKSMNASIDAILTQSEEEIKGELQSDAQRSRVASGKHSAKKNK